MYDFVDPARWEDRAAEAREAREAQTVEEGRRRALLMRAARRMANRRVAAAFEAWLDVVRLYGSAASSAAAAKMAEGLAAAAGRAALRGWHRHAGDEARKRKEMAKMLRRWIHGRIADAFGKMRAAAAAARAQSRRAAVVMKRVWLKQAFREWAAVVVGEKAHLAKQRVIFQRILKFAATRAFNQVSVPPGVG